MQDSAPDFWRIPNEQQAMLRNTLQWDPQTVAGGAREPPREGIAWPRPNLRDKVCQTNYNLDQLPDVFQSMFVFFSD